jgi:hypothetical protein
MTDSYTYNSTETFTIAHAKRIAAKVAADLLRFQRFYSKPTVEAINRYELELVALLKAGYLDKVIYGFKRDGKWVEALRYHALPDGTLMADDDPGKIRPRTDVPEASFGSFLTKNSRWDKLSPDEKEAFEASLPFRRLNADEPPILNGYWSNDRNYSAGGRGIGRSTLTRY